MTLKTVLNSLSVFISSVIMYTSLIGVDVPRKLHWTPGETVSSLLSVLEGWKSSKYFFFLVVLKSRKICFTVLILQFLRFCQHQQPQKIFDFSQQLWADELLPLGHKYSSFSITAAFKLVLFFLQGYTAHIISTISEWFLAFSFISFFLTYIRDFQVLFVSLTAAAEGLIWQIYS